MKSEWQEVTIAEVATDVTVGHVGPMAAQYVDEGIPFLRSLNIEPFSLNMNDLRYIKEDFHKRLKKSALSPGDVVIIRTGKPGACAVIPSWLKDANCSDLVIIRCGPQVRPDYLCYVVNTIAGHHIAAHTVGAVQQHFNVGSARTLSFPLPPLSVQDAILGVLKTIDEKIELNRRMNETLEAQARALFRDWFVDFGPVKAKMAGDAPYLAPDLWSLFPDRLAEDGVPKGWAEAEIYSVAQVIYGAPFASKRFNTERVGRPLVRIRDLPKQAAGQFTDEVHRKEHLIRPGDIVVGMDGEFRAYIWAGIPSLMNQRVCSFEPIDRSDRAFVWLTIEPQLAECERSAIGTTVIHLGKKDIDRFSAIDPGPQIRSAFGALTEPLIDKMVANAEEARTLAETRDLLLPKLMSGEIRVSEAKQLAEELV